MKKPRIEKIDRNGRKISCAIWDEHGEKTPVFCVHGLTRNGRDFDYFATHLSDNRSVYAPDVAGRGQSDWLKESERYTYDLYAEDAIHLLDTLGLEQVDWVGTSMGGILGQRVAYEHPQRIRKLVVNDIGALITVQMMQRLNDYVGQRMVHPSEAHAENYLRACYAGFGLKESWQWNHLFEHSFTIRKDGKHQLVYDPNLLNAILDEEGRITLQENISLWPFWENLEHPILLLRGEFSDFLSHEMAQEMLERNPHATLIEFKNCGHAPALMNEEQVLAIRTWLDA